MSQSNIDTSKFAVGLGTHLLSGAMTSATGFWDRLGKLESMVLSEQLEDIQISKPVYVAGLARSGTTIALEVLASHPDVSTHRYCDFPAIFTPYWWGKSNEHSKTVVSERAHGDGLLVSNQSPEAMEEMLWMAHFKRLHDVKSSAVLEADVANDGFENNYRQHIKKLILLRGGNRYVAKGNYNITRLKYIQKIFPDARFIIPIRDPVNHIASLMKQHQLFCEGQKDHPRAIAHLKRVGHFEFGLDRRPVNVGDCECIEQIQSFWNQGEEVRGWATYWAMLYGWLHRYLEQSPALAKQVLVVKYEDLCRQPGSTLDSILDFADLHEPDLIDSWSKKIKAPEYYSSGFTSAETELIREQCEHVSALFGYE